MKNDLAAIVLFMAMFLAAIFIPAHFREKADYKERVEGILKDKKDGSRGFYYLYIFDKNQNKTIERSYNRMSTFDTLKIGDSVIKNANSWHIQVYRNSGNGYQFVDSFGIGRFN
jgi:hypothetical protein